MEVIVLLVLLALLVLLGTQVNRDLLALREQLDLVDQQVRRVQAEVAVLREMLDMLTANLTAPVNRGQATIRGRDTAKEDRRND